MSCYMVVGPLNELADVKISWFAGRLIASPTPRASDESPHDYGLFAVRTVKGASSLDNRYCDDRSCPDEHSMNWPIHGFCGWLTALPTSKALGEPPHGDRPSAMRTIKGVPLTSGTATIGVAWGSKLLRQ